MSTTPDSNDGENRTMALLQRIQSGGLAPTSITLADRRQLVAVLMADGYSTSEIAQILKVSDRSIERDKQSIRQANALVPDPRFVPQMVGRLLGEAELAVQRIRKAARDRSVPAQTKVDAEHRCYQIISDFTQALQRLGYLPMAAQKMEADVTHYAGDVPAYATLRAETQRLRQIAIQTLPEGEVGEPDVVQRLLTLQKQIEQADLASQVESLSTEIGAMPDEEPIDGES